MRRSFFPDAKEMGTMFGSIEWAWQRICTCIAWLVLIVYSAFMGMALLNFAADRYLPTDRPATPLDWVFVWLFAGGCWLVAGLGITWVLKAVELAKKCNAWYVANCIPERHKTVWFFRNELRLYTVLMLLAFPLLGFAGLAFRLSAWGILTLIASCACVVSCTRLGVQCKIMLGRTPETCEEKAATFWMLFSVSSLFLLALSSFMNAIAIAR